MPTNDAVTAEIRDLVNRNTDLLTAVLGRLPDAPVMTQAAGLVELQKVAGRLAKLLDKFT